MSTNKGNRVKITITGKCLVGNTKPLSAISNKNSYINATMFDYQNFDEVFAFDTDCFYDGGMVTAIEGNRKKLEGLFVERVMKLLGIKRPPRYYPPKSNADLRGLHKAVCETSGADHHKISILYYILLDFDWPTGRREYSTTFESQAFLPQKYQIYMKGLWHMDRQEFEDALQYLTHPSIIPTFPDDILEILVKFSNNDLTLPLAYYHTVQPTLTNLRAIECLFSALARTSVTEAFYFSRGQSDSTQRHMFEMLISLALNNSSKETIADRCVELVNLPLTVQEEEWFEEYLLQGEGRGLKKSKDTVMMRKIGTGNFDKSLHLKGFSKSAIAGLDWGMLSDAVEDGLGPRATS